MLDSIRKKSDNLIYTAIIAATVAVMAFYGVFSGRGGGGGGQGAAAWVNGDPISRREFQQELEMKMNQYQAMLGGQYDEKLLNALQIPQRTLEELIQFKLLSQQAEKLGIRVPDEELADHIRSLPYFQKDGKFDEELYSKIPNKGVEEAQQRERLRLVKFQTYLVDRVHLTPEALQKNFQLNNTKVDLSVAKIDFPALAAAKPPSASEVQAYLKSAPDKEIQDYYDAHRADFTDKAKVQLRQIRVGIPFQANAQQKTDARKKIDGIAAEVTPQNFAEVARKKSDDEYAKKGGEVGWVSRGSLEAPLEAAVDKLEVGKLSAPVETPFGYFILMLENKKPEAVHPIAEVKGRIAEKIVAEKDKKKFEEEKKKAWDAKLAKGESIEPDLKALKVEVKKTGPFALGSGYVPNVGQADEIVDAVFELSPEHPLPSKLLPFQNAYYFIKLASVEPAKEADFAKEKASVERTVSTGLQTEIITHWVGDLQKQAKIEREIKFDNGHNRESSR